MPYLNYRYSRTDSSISGAYIYGFNTLDALEYHPSISDVCAAGTAYTRGSVPLVLAVFGFSALLILPALAVFRPPVLQYSQ